MTGYGKGKQYNNDNIDFKENQEYIPQAIGFLESLGGVHLCHYRPMNPQLFQFVCILKNAYHFYTPITGLDITFIRIFLTTPGNMRYIYSLMLHFLLFQPLAGPLCPHFSS